MSSIRWIPVAGYEAGYEISSAGEVRVKARDILDKDGSVITRLDAKLVEIQRDKDTNRPYVILHDGKSYQKEDLEMLLNKSYHNHR